MSVGQVCVDVDLLLDPGGEVRDVAVNPGSEHFTEAHAAPRRQAEQRPATAALLTHQWAAAVTLNTHVKHTHTEKLCGLCTSCLDWCRCYHAGVDGSSFIAGTKHSGSDGLHVEVGLTLRQRDDPDLPFLQFKGHCTKNTG